MMFSPSGSQATAWAAQTASEIASVADADGSILVLPIGSIEQHGAHLPVATDTLLVNEVATEGADRVAEDLPVLVAPPFWAGFSPHHLPFGGTLSLEFDTMREAVEDVADTALSNGFDALLLLNGHGGNKSLVGAATSTIGKGHPDTEVLGLTYFDLAEPFIDDLRESETGGMAHGGEFETALMLHCYPDMVREGHLEVPYMDEPYDQSVQDLLVSGPLSVYRGFDEYSDSGAIGDPSLSTSDQGASLLERLGDELEDLLREIHANNRS